MQSLGVCSVILEKVNAYFEVNGFVLQGEPALDGQRSLLVVFLCLFFVFHVCLLLMVGGV